MPAIDGGPGADQARSKLFAAHGFVLAARSPFFAAALSIGMAESTSRVVTLRCFPPPGAASVRWFLRFLYTGSMDGPALISGCEEGLRAQEEDDGDAGTVSGPQERVAGKGKDGASRPRVSGSMLDPSLALDLLGILGVDLGGGDHGEDAEEDERGGFLQLRDHAILTSSALASMSSNMTAGNVLQLLRRATQLGAQEVRSRAFRFIAEQGPDATRFDISALQRSLGIDVEGGDETSSILDKGGQGGSLRAAASPVGGGSGDGWSWADESQLLSEVLCAVLSAAQKAPI